MGRTSWARWSAKDAVPLEAGDRIAVVGGGPAGSLFAYFFRRLAELVELDVEVDIFEPRSFARSGPAGCNHCGGIVSESLVQVLATEGVQIPEGVIQRGIDSYVLHMDAGDVRIDPPGHEKRIAAVYRGNGPRVSTISDAVSFDRHLLGLAESAGARIERRLVAGFEWYDGQPKVVCADGFAAGYDLVVLASGVNSHLFDSVEKLGLGFRAPATAKTFITELELGRELVERTLGTSMHVFLLDLPRLEFGALVPKGDYVTVCLLGDGIDDELVRSFLESREVRACFPEGLLPPTCCHCFPRINVAARGPVWADRFVLVGDSGVTRLYKDGIGASYRAAKAAATTAVLQGVSASAFERYYGPTCRRIARDNRIGRFLFTCGHSAQHVRGARRAILRMVRHEQSRPEAEPRMSGILWDLFTGSASYGDILRRGFHPAFGLGIAWNLLVGAWSDPPPLEAPEGSPLHV